MNAKANNTKDKAQELYEKLYLAAKKSKTRRLGLTNFESARKKVIRKPCEGELHARFDEGAVDESPLLHSTSDGLKYFLLKINS